MQLSFAFQPPPALHAGLPRLPQDTHGDHLATVAMARRVGILRRRFGLSEPVAHAIAHLAYGEGRA